MSQRKEKAEADRALAFLHQLAGGIVDRRNMVGVDGVAQPEAVRQERRPEQHCIAGKRSDRPSPGTEIGGDQNGVETDDLAAQTGGPIVEQTGELPHSASPRTRLFDEFGFLGFGRGRRWLRLKGEAQLVRILLGINPDGPALRQLAE